MKLINNTRFQIAGCLLAVNVILIASIGFLRAFDVLWTDAMAIDTLKFFLLLEVIGLAVGFVTGGSYEKE